MARGWLVKESALTEAGASGYEGGDGALPSPAVFLAGANSV
jgi:hypothetical protein